MLACYRLLLAALLPGFAAADPPVASVVESTLPTAVDQVRQLAFDGDAATFFASSRDAREGDHFTLVLDRPVAVKSIAVTTGRPDRKDPCEKGTLEVSADGKAFEKMADFAEGSARAEPKGREVRAIRIKAAGDFGHPLVIREIVIDSEPAVATFRYPVEFVLDVADAPEMKEWVEKAALACERAYPMLNDELKSEGYTPARLIRMSLKKNYRGVAATSGSRITGSVKFFTDHPDDIGAMVHETAHVVQHYRGRGNPSWLVEGVADYVRFFKYEPGKIGPIDPQRARYNRSYRVTAAFLAYLVEKYDPQIVRKLNARMREGTYKEDAFKEFTGKTVQELDEEWRATLKR